MQQQTKITLDNNLPFSSGINSSHTPSRKLNKDELLKEEERAAADLMHYLRTMMDRDKYIPWLLDVTGRLSNSSDNRDPLYFLSKLSEIILIPHTQDYIIREFNGFDLFGDSLNGVIKQINQAFYEWWSNTSDPIDTDEFDNYFIMVKHLVNINNLYSKYYWAGRRLINLFNND